MWEEDRRQKEEAFMRSQHDAIGRRPGGKKVLQPGVNLDVATIVVTQTGPGLRSSNQEEENWKP